MSRRKELITMYKNTWKPHGVYCFRNKKNGKMLIGISQNLSQIENRIRFELRMGSSYFSTLQKDWNEMGSDSFEFLVLEELKEQKQNPNFDYVDALESLLETYLEKYQSFDEKGYNHNKAI